MKKIYLLAGVALMTGSVMAQSAVKPNLSMKKFPINAKFEEPHASHVVNNSNRVQIAADDFSTASNWTIATTGQGTWQIVTTMPTDQGNYMGAMASTTAANGFATFDGIQYLVAGSVDPQNTTLTYGTTLDLSTYPAVTVDFEQRYRPFNTDHTYLEVSNDNGATWTTFEMNTQYAVNATPVQNALSINVSAATMSSSTVQVRFRWEETSGDDQYGSGYGWCVDDFSVNTAPNDNLVLSNARIYDPNSITSWGDELNYTMMPSDQIADVAFAGDINNQGAAAQTNVRITSDVTGAGTGSFSGAGAALASGASMSDVTTNALTPSAVGTYDFTITANYDNFGTDVSPADNQYTGSLDVTSDEWARDDNTYTGSGLWNGAGNGYIIGPVFEVQNDVAIKRVRAAFSSATDAGVIACAQIYEIDGSGNFNVIGDNCGTSYEKTLAASDISGNSTIVWVDFVVCANLTAGGFYFPAIQHYGGADDLVIMAGGSADTSTVFLLDGTDNTWYYTLSIPKIRFVEGACDVNVAEVVEPGFTLSQNVPNPTNATTTIYYSLPKNSEVNFQIVDVTGKVVESTNMGDKPAGDYQMVIDGNRFSKGIYFYTMTAGGQKITRRMIITE